jgi:hypothetical protein
MNLFFLDISPKKAASYHCDKHVVKMILETAQLLYSAHWILNKDTDWVLMAPFGGYKKTHTGHPLSVWVRSSIVNYLYTCSLGLYLCAEYTDRYNRIHKTQQHLEWLVNNIPKTPSYTDKIDYKTKRFFGKPFVKGMTPIPLCMPEIYFTNCAVESYRKYYIGDKKGFAKWKHNYKPPWWKI